MRTPSFLAVAAFALLVAACNRNGSEDAPPAAADSAAVEAPTAQSAPGASAPVAPAPPVPGDAAQAPTPPAPIVEGMYVIYACDDGTEPRITFSGNLVKVELSADSAPVILSARASATRMSEIYSDDALTLHRDGLGITLESGGGKTARCSEREASA